MCISHTLFSQSADLYTFTPTSSVFTPLVAGTSMSSIEADDVLSASTPIGFPFFFEGLPYTSFKVSSNGFMTFGNGTSSMSSNSSSPSSNMRPLLAPLWDDLDGNAPNSAASYQVSGTAPDRVFTFEWLNYEWSFNSSVNNISFQVKLYETTNKIEFVYRDEAGIITSPDATIGILGTSSYLTLNNTSSSPVASSTSFTTTISSPPASGQIYRFSIPEICFAPNGVKLDSVFTTSAYFSWFDQSRRWYFDYEYGPRGFTPGTGISDSTRGTNIMLSALAPGQDYDFYIRNYCNLLDSSIFSSPIPFTTIPTCYVALSLADSGTGITSTYLSWNDTNSTSSSTWVVSYGPVGFNPDTGTKVLASSNPFNLTGLSGSTTYEWYVRSICAIGDSSNWSASSSFTTNCPSVSVFPFLETFDGASTTENCWTILNLNSDGDSWNLNYTSNTFSGNQVAAMYTDYNSGNNDDYLISPQFTLTGGQRLKFQTRVQSSSEPNDYQIVLSSTGKNPADFSSILLTDTVNSTTYSQREIDLSAYTGNYYIAIKIPTGGLDGWRLYIDDFLVEDIPNCFVPNALTASNVTGSSADLAWTDNNTTAPGSWQISYGPVGFTAGSGTQVTASTNPFTVTGLIGSSVYEWYVRASCTPGDTSAWSSAGSFTTECPAITSFPYTQDFDGSLTSGVWDCWKVLNIDGGATWSQSSTYISPRSGSWTAHGMGNNDDYLITPKLSLGTGSYRVKFWDVVESSSYNNTYMVLVSTTGTAPSDFTDTLITINCTNTTMQEHVVNLTGYTNQDIYVAFHQTFSAASYYGFGIDDFTAEKIPSCFVPNALTASNVTGSSADLAWTDNNTSAPGSWQISYGPVGFTAGSGTQVTASTNPFTLTGLMGSTTYDWYVRASCTPGDTSAWSGMGSFTTLCPIAPMPYLEDFSSWQPNCWDLTGGNSSSVWIFRNPGIAEANFYSVSSGASQIMASQRINVNSNARLKFDWSSSFCYGANDQIEVKARSNSGAWNSIWLKSGSALNSNSGSGCSSPGSFITETINLDPLVYTNTTVEIQFIATSDYGGDFYLDNVIVEKIPTCTPGSALSGYNPTQVSHDVTWTPGAFDVSWEVEYGAPGYTAGTGNLITGVTNDSLTIAGLISGTSYDVYYRGICSAGDTGAFIGPLTITTPIFPIAYDTTVISSCYSFTTPIGGVTHTVSNIYFDTLRASVPHLYDSAIHVYDVTVNKLKTGLLVTSGCDGVTSASGKFYNVTGVYLDSLPSAAGCDSITTIDLTITFTEYFRDTVFACDSNDFRGMKLTTSGVYSDTNNTGACDKIYIRHLTVAYASYKTFNHFVCDSFVSPTGKVWNTSGTYMDTLMNATGCDSIMTFNLTFGYISYNTTTATVCDSYTSPSGKVWTTSGTYLDTIVNASGCDSAMTFNLTINYTKTFTNVVTACESYVLPDGRSINYTGSFIDTIPTTLGCDSIITTVLTINYNATSSISATVCGSYTSPSGKVWTTSGTYLDTIPTTAGCDSLMTISIVVKQLTAETRRVSACGSYTVPETGTTYTTSGTYTDIATNVFGCPKTITTILTINTANAGAVSVSGITLSASAIGVDYKWLDCENNYSYILGETNQTYTPIRNGEYAVEITTIDGCKDTSLCTDIRSVSLDEYKVSASDILIYPNPSNSIVTVDIAQLNAEENVSVKLFDAIGKLVYAREVSSLNNKVTFDVSNLEAGIYSVSVSNDFFGVTKKVAVIK